MAKTGRKGTPTRLAIDREMTIYRAAELKHVLLAPLAAGTGLDLDLAQVTELDTAGIQLLLLARHEAQRRGLTLRVRRASVPVRAALTDCNLLTAVGLAARAAAGRGS